MNKKINKSTDYNTTISYDEYSEEYRRYGAYHDYPCIEKLIGDKDYWMKHHPRHSFEPSQFIRFAWVTIRAWSGYTPDEILEEAKSFGWDDFREDTTRYQINQIFLRGYVPPSCRRIQEEGYCLKDECPLYRWKYENVLKNINRLNEL